MIDLHALFEYNEDSPSGLIWRTGRWKSRPAGRKAQRKNGNPHNYQIQTRKQTLCVHRVIWELFNGPIPFGMVIDHMDGNPWNNKITNLRMVTPKTNTQNARKRKDNTTGVTGVCFVIMAGLRYVQAKVADDCKRFRIDQFGEELAFQMAVKWRESRLNLLNLQGENFSERHGR